MKFIGFELGFTNIFNRNNSNENVSANIIKNTQAENTRNILDHIKNEEKVESNIEGFILFWNDLTFFYPRF